MDNPTIPTGRLIIKAKSGTVDFPVEGVMIQMCDDSACSLVMTDAEGIACFESPSGKAYEVHVLTVPEGYEEDTTVYHTAETYEDVIIELAKK